MRQATYHLRATLLPFGESPTDFFIVDGRITFAPQSDARELSAPGGFVAPGLVDAHTHLLFAREPNDPSGRAVIDEHRRLHLHAGSLLLRDLGATADDILLQAPDDGLPVVQPAGQSLLVENRFPFFVTAAKDLSRAALAQAEAGAQWIKVFVDWPGWPGGEEEPEFGNENQLSYPQETLSEMVRTAHGAGARVAIHAFGAEGARGGIDAGVDSIEHGWGLDEAMLSEMAAKGIAWTPMLAIAEPMLRGAQGGGAPRPAQAKWIQASMEKMKTLLPAAHRAGVVILAGTDWFPSVTIAEEVTLLHRFGLDPEAAIDAATSSARKFLRAPGLVEDAPADLVLFRQDPRQKLDVLRAPEVIMFRGKVVRGQGA